MNDSRYYKRTLVKKSLQSHYLMEQRDIRIYLPPGYNELSSYPVVYCQDGEEFFNFGRIATQATKLILDEGLEPLIIVGVDVHVPQRTAQYAPEGNSFSAYCRFFAEELVPWMDDHYPTRPETSSRILAGDSLGGTVSLHLALDYPQLFHQIISLSGAFLTSTQERIKQDKDLSRINMYMLIGLEESEVTTDRGSFNFLEANRTTKELLEGRGAQILYSEKPGKHIWGFWQTELPEGLRHFLS